MVYHVRLEQFEGPLDLLLRLIEREKLDITRVSLAQIADQYLEYVAEDRDISLENLASFLSIASRLILIKSRALLPVLHFEDDEEETIDDLEARLREYRRFRDAAIKLGSLFEKRKVLFARESFSGVQVVFFPPGDVDGGALAGVFRSVLGSISVTERLPEKELEKRISLEERIFHLKTVLADEIETSFSKLRHSKADKVDVIVSFLAILELVKQRFLVVEQKEFFGDMKLRKHIPDV